MKVTDYYDSDWLTVDDLAGRTLDLRVKVVVEANVKEQDGSETTKLAVHFSNSAKPLLLGKLNAKYLAKQLGGETDTWKDANITLAAVPMNINGRLQDTLRVIACRPAIAQQQQ